MNGFVSSILLHPHPTLLAISYIEDLLNPASHTSHSTTHPPKRQQPATFYDLLQTIHIFLKWMRKVIWPVVCALTSLKLSDMSNLHRHYCYYFLPFATVIIWSSLNSYVSNCPSSYKHLADSTTYCIASTGLLSSATTGFRRTSGASINLRIIW